MIVTKRGCVVWVCECVGVWCGCVECVGVWCGCVECVGVCVCVECVCVCGECLMIGILAWYYCDKIAQERATGVRACNSLKFETGWNLTSTMHAA